MSVFIPSSDLSQGDSKVLPELRPTALGSCSHLPVFLSFPLSTPGPTYLLGFIPSVCVQLASFLQWERSPF